VIERKKHIVFAGGGTGGHLYPAIAIADALSVMKPELQAVFIGAKNRLEATIVPELGYEFVGMDMASFPRKLSVQAFKELSTIIRSIFRAKSILKKYEPVCVVGTGGFVSAPVLIASLGRYHTVVHEQNTIPGIATKYLRRWVNRMFVSFGNTKEYFKNAKNVTVSGNPVRAFASGQSKEQLLEMFGLMPGKTTVLVFGGSLGSARINNAIAKSIDELHKMNIQLIWQTGEQMYDSLAAQYSSYDSIRLFKFIKDMWSCYRVADVVVCRAGATTIAELSAVGSAAILVPYPYAANDHQRKNAEELQKRNACMVVEDADAERALLSALMLLVENSEKRDELSRNVREINTPDAARTIAQYILGISEGEDGRE